MKSDLTEKQECTTNDTITFTYEERVNEPGDFDYYIFAINSSSSEVVIKDRMDENRLVEFRNLVPGVEYKVNTTTVSGKQTSKPSYKSIKTSESNFSLLSCESKLACYVDLFD